MSEADLENKIQVQKTKVFGNNPALILDKACKVGEGVLKLDDVDKEYFTSVFAENNCSLCYFIPASGSGSRMFQFLYEFLEAPTSENQSQVENFLNSIEDFAFFEMIPGEMKQLIRNQKLDLESIVNYIVSQDGLGYGLLPKGLIPFHANKPFILNPFQEHVLQGAKIKNKQFSFHFTIQKSFQERIIKNIENIEGLTGEKYKVEFSEQDLKSNSYAFLDEGTVLKDDQSEIITRPAGHGALLKNLNEINEDLIFIKNIDNVQHIEKSGKSIKTWKVLGGIVLDFKKEALEIFENPSKEKLLKLNKKFQLYSESQLNACATNEDIRNLLNRPTRACGMVKNIGQPGGGPFWVNENGIVSKQIVEKAQIATNGEQYKLMVQSTHFNPVMIAASPKSLTGEKFDLTDYCDDSKYFIVNKTQKGQKIRFMELPGLWNGAMSNWNTIFVEIPSSTFSPVKTILDLLSEAHQK